MKMLLVSTILFLGSSSFAAVCLPCKAASDLERVITQAQNNPDPAKRIVPNAFDPVTIDRQFEFIEASVTRINDLLKSTPFTEAHADATVRLLAVIVHYDVQGLVPEGNRAAFRRVYGSGGVLKAKFDSQVQSGAISQLLKDAMLEYMGVGPAGYLERL